MKMGRTFLLCGGAASAIAALAHLAVIAGGPAWYRFFGAGERLARAAERGEAWPAVVTLGIAAVLLGWSAFAFSGAGFLPRLPMLKPVLIAITAVYLLRGAAIVFSFTGLGPYSPTFVFWSSLIVLSIGVLHLAGLVLRWSAL